MGQLFQKEIQHLIRATSNSLAGIQTAWKHELAFRLELVSLSVIIPGGFWLGTSAVERVLLIGTGMMVLITELLNTAIETVVDRIGFDYHPLSGRAKDLGSAAVFVSLVTTAIIWGVFVFERLKTLF